MTNTQLGQAHETTVLGNSHAADRGLRLHPARDRRYEALGCPKTLVRFTAAEGANGHCEGWNRSRFDQQVFDWLDDSLHVTKRR
jgi:hypothetical protein